MVELLLTKEQEQVLKPDGDPVVWADHLGTYDEEVAFWRRALGESNQHSEEPPNDVLRQFHLTGKHSQKAHGRRMKGGTLSAKNDKGEWEPVEGAKGKAAGGGASGGGSGGAGGGEGKPSLGQTRIPKAGELHDAGDNAFSEYMLDWSSQDKKIMKGSGKPSETYPDEGQAYKKEVESRLSVPMTHEAMKNPKMLDEIASFTALDSPFRAEVKEIREILADPKIKDTTKAKMAEDFRAKTLEPMMRDRVRSFVGGWANTSADESPQALMLQRMASEEFGVPMAPHLAKAIQNAAAPIKHAEERNGETARFLLREQYRQTQAELKERGITEVTVYRGMQVPRAANGSRFDTDVNLQPMSSFSVEYRIADSFSFSGLNKTDAAVTAMRVPSSRILSTPKTGFGCLSEGEAVVLGGMKLPAAVVWSPSGGGTENPFPSFRSNDWDAFESHARGKR